MPRKIIGAAFISLDGVVQAPGGPGEDESGGFDHGGWFQPVGDEAVDEQIGALFSGDFDLLLGRRTYDLFASYWPFQPLDNPFAVKFAEAGKYVLTRSDMPLDWANSHRLAGLDALAATKEEDGPNLVIQGSSTLYPQLLEAALLDRLVLMIAPVTLGAGKRLFGDRTPPGTMKLIEQRTGAGGCLIATYEPAGPIKTGTFETQAPSEKELSRRERAKAGEW